MAAADRGHDQNLLFGILAFQLDFVTQGQLIEAMQAWMLDKVKPLGQVLVEKGILTADRRQLLTALVAEHVRQHGNDPQKSLDSVGPLGTLRHDLVSLGDPQVSLRMSQLPRPAVEEGLLQTILPSTAGDPVPEQRFSVLRPLAEGGLGMVSVALDTELTREVALKEIKPRFADHPNDRARFLKEAEITGRLEHPGIVPVYGLGSYRDGRPYYAMRMIKGSSLQEAISEYHAKDKEWRDSGAGTLALRELLQRFIDVCNAVEYAHSRGILHRDLKPANIMLGKFRETLVVDWGLAKPVGEVEQSVRSDETVIVPELGGESVPTRMGEVVGTIAFMSPEQAAGRVSAVVPASDIYSLGATLYNLLTGTLAQKDADAGKLLRNIQLGHFPKPREVHKGVPRALEAICLKAMALKIEDRYPSAAALAGDIEHYLADEPVTAHAEPPHMRARRWMRKHPGIVGSLAATILLSLVTSLGLTAYVNRTNHQLELKNEEALQARRRAESVTDLMVGSFQSPDPERDGRTITVYEVLVNAAANPELGQQSDPQIGSALNHAIGKTLCGLGLYQEAVPILEQSRSFHIAAFGATDPRTLAAMNDLGYAYMEAGDFDRGLSLLQETLDVRSEQLGPEHEDTLNSMVNLAAGFRRAGMLDKALPMLEKNLERTRAKLGPFEKGTLTSMNNLAEAYQKANQIDKAVPLLRETWELARSHFGEEDLATIALMHNLASGLQAAGQLEEAASLAERAATLRRNKLTEDDPFTRRSMRLLQDVALQRNDFDLATQMGQALLAAVERQTRTDPQELARVHLTLAESLLGQGQTETAIAEVTRAIDYYAAQAPDGLDLPRARGILGCARALRGDGDEATRMQQDAYEQLKSRMKEIDPAQRWYVARACERLVQTCQAAQNSDAIDRWQSELKSITQAIQQLRNAGVASK